MNFGQVLARLDEGVKFANNDFHEQYIAKGIVKIDGVPVPVIYKKTLPKYQTRELSIEIFNPTMSDLSRDDWKPIGKIFRK